MAKPAVRRLESTLGESASILHVNLMSRLGREIASPYGIRSVPTLLVVRKGSEMMRQVGHIQDDAVVDLVSTWVPIP